MSEKTLKETFPNYLYDPLWFAKMENAPWFNEISPQQLAIKYVGQRSGSKITSPLLDDLLENESVEMNSLIANVLMGCENYRWKKLWETMNYDYNPIENYNMKESSTDTRDGSTEVDHTTIGNNMGSNNTIIKNTSNILNSVYGFNSVESVNSDDSNGTSDGNSTETSESNNSETRKGNTTLSDKNLHSLTRSGNIGVTTTQQMITQERELVIWKFFDDVVFADMDKYLVCPIYK